MYTVASPSPGPGPDPDHDLYPRDGGHYLILISAILH